MRRLSIFLTLALAASCASCTKTPSDAPRAPDKATPQESRLKPASPKTKPQVAAPAQNAPPAQPPAPVTPFRLVLKQTYGSILEHQGRRIYAGENGVFDLTTGETLASCQFLRGYLLSGKNLYFAARMSPYSACPDAPFLLERVGQKWQLQRFIDAHDIRIDEWIAGTTIAAVVPYRGGPPWGYELVKIAGGVTPPRPHPGTKHPTDPDQKCYSELQGPMSLHAFPSGKLMVVGESRCDLGATDDEELTMEEQRNRNRPVIETFLKGKYTSTLLTLPFDEVLTIVETKSENLFFLGKALESEQEDGPFTLVLYSFDGSSLEKIETELGDAQALLMGPGDALWLLGEAGLRPLEAGASPLTLPPDCQYAHAWFQGEHAWLTCPEGIYTTDPEQRPIELASGTSECEELQPHPEYAVRGVYQRSSEAGGCGGRPSEPPPNKGKQGGKPSPPSLYDF